MSQQNGKKKREVGGIDISGSALDFSMIQPNEVPISNLFGKNYILREASAATAIAYRAAAMKYQKTDAQGLVIGLDENFLYEIPALISKCLYIADADGKVPHRDGLPDPKHLVSDVTIKGWINRIQWALFEKLKEISPQLLIEAQDEEQIDEQIESLQKRKKELADRKQEQELKNLPDSSMAGSP